MGTLKKTAIQWISVDETNHAIHWIVIYPVDSVIHSLNRQLGQDSEFDTWLRTLRCVIMQDTLSLVFTSDAAQAKTQ